MSILNVDKIQPIGSGSTVTVNATDTILTNAQAGVITATSATITGEVTIPTWLVHAGDTNTKFGFEGPDTITFETSGSERLRITSGGNIGIGEDVPDLKLHVNGVNGLPATSGTTPVGHLILRAKAQNASHSMYMGVSNAGPWSSWIQAADANNLATTYPLLLNPNGGNIGINCTPSKQLQVKGTDVAFRLESTVATGRIGMEFYDTSAQKGYFGYPSSGNNNMSIQQNEAADLYFDVNGAERLRITSAGVIQTPGTTKIKPHTVGIGTTSITNTGVGTAYGEMMYNTTTNNVQVYTTTSGWYNVSDLQGYYKTAAAASSDGMNHYWGGSSSTSIISGLTPNGSPGGSPSAPGVNLTTQSYYGDYPYFDFASGNDQLGWEFTKSGTKWGAGPFTICFWVDLQGVTLESESTFVQIGNHSGLRSLYTVSADASRQLKAITIGDDTGSNTDAQLIGNTWHHVAVTYNTSRVTKYYIDGTLVRSHTHNSALNVGHSTQHIYLGYGYWNSSSSNKASISHMSDIGIWDAKELNATEIKNVYNAKRIIRGY